MDPKQQTTSLDPKLKEAYERVMGTGASPTAAGPNPLPPTAAPPIIPTPQPQQKVDALISPPLPTIKKADAPGLGVTLPTSPMSPINPSVPPVNPSITPTSSTASTSSLIPGSSFSTVAPPSSNTPAPLQQGVSIHPTNPVVSPPVAHPVGTVVSGITPPSTPVPTGHPAPVQPQTNPVTLAAGTKSHAFVAGKKKAAISPVVIAIAGIVFVLVYTLFWVKFFGVKLPFLP